MICLFLYVPEIGHLSDFISHLIFFRHAGAAPEAEERVVAGAVLRQRVLADVSSCPPRAAAAAPGPARVVPAVHVGHVQGHEIGPQALSLLLLWLVLLAVANDTTAVTANAGRDRGATDGVLVAAAAAVSAAAAVVWTPTAAVWRKTPREAREVSVVEHERLELPQERWRDLHLQRQRARRVNYASAPSAPHSLFSGALIQSARQSLYTFGVCDGRTAGFLSPRRPPTSSCVLLRCTQTMPLGVMCMPLLFTAAESGCQLLTEKQHGASHSTQEKHQGCRFAL